jgi:Ca2+-binding RTX toxin-like protein
LVFGNDGNDSIRGGKGNDGLVGGNGRDEVYGEDGDDFLDGISESVPVADLLDGGRGRDICVADDLDTVIRCEQVIRPSASRQRQADADALETRAREAFEAKYGPGR